MIQRMNSKDIDDILNEIDDNEANEQMKRQEILHHFWNNFKRIFHSDAFEYYRSSVDDSYKYFGLDFTEKQWTEIIRGIKDLNKDAKYSAWKTYFETMNKEYMDKFKQWYHSLNVIQEKALNCHQWKFPQFHKKDAELLVLGFYRNESKLENVAMGDDIIRMLINFCGNFYTNIKDLFQQWDKEETSLCKRSGIFSFKSLNFCLYFEKQEHNTIGDDKYMLKIEYFGAPKKEFEQCIVELLCIFNEKRFKSYCTLTIKSDDNHQREHLFAGLTSDDFDSLIKMNATTFSFDIYIQKVTFINDTKNSIEYIGQDLVKPTVLTESLFDTDYCSSFIWNLSQNQVNEIMKVKDNSMKQLQTIIKSETFVIYGLKFQVWIYITIDSDEIDFRIHFIGIPEKIYKLSFWYHIAMNDKILRLYHENSNEELDKGKFSFRLQTDLHKQHFINLNETLKSFTIYFHTVNVYDKNDNEIKLAIDSNTILNNEQKFQFQSVRWKLENKFLEEWKQSNSITNFFSKPFNIGPFVFILELYPRRKIWGNWGKRYMICIVEMHLISRPFNVSKLTIHECREDTATLFFQEMVREISMKRSCITDYGPNDISGGCYEDELFPVMAIDYLQENTPVILGFDIEILSVLDDKDNDITFEIINEEVKEIELNSFSKPKFQHFVCKISDKFYNKNMCKGNEWCSEIIEMFGSKWIFRFEGGSVRLKLCRLDNPNNISILCLHCKCMLNDIEWASSKTIRFDNIVDIDIDDDNNNITFYEGSLHQSDIENINECISFELEFILFNIYDENKNDISDKYKNLKIQTIEMKDNIYCCEWKIPSKLYSSEIAKTSYGSQFCSNIFECFGCKFYICFVPCYKYDKNTMNLYISLADIDVNISWLLVQYKFSIPQLNIEIFKLRTVGDVAEYRTVSFEKFSKRDEIENMEYLLIKCEIKLFYMCDKNGMEITDNFIHSNVDDEKSNAFELQELKMSDELETHKWKIEKIIQSEVYISPFYKIKDIGIEYQIEFISKDYYTKISVCIKSLPNDISSISLMIMIDFKYNEDWIEYNATVSDAIQFQHGQLKLILTNVVKIGRYLNKSATLGIKTKVIAVQKK